MTACKLGIDVGGTFTDLFVHDPDRGIATYKVPSTPEDPSRGILEGLEVIARARGVTLAELAAATDTIVHGTTVTTNAVLTRSGAVTALLTTDGLRDALEMRRGIREEHYDNHCMNVVPLVPRRLRRPVRGRLDYRGEEVTPLATADVEEALGRLEAEGVAAVAVCFMNAFANPAHERRAADLVRAALPDAYLSVSSEVLPSIRFYDRVSTTVLNAYVGPVLAGYLGKLTAKLDEIGFRGVLLVMQSNGGVALPDLTVGRAANTVLSGPAGGPRAAAVLVEAHGGRDCIVTDMGGTSFDASLVQDGAVALSSGGEIDRLRIALPMLQITTIGAGGGSIGWLDEGGLLRMGPQSAGAVPGPACYGHGGDRPTCTDADLLLGYLDPDFFAGGSIRLDPDAARAAIARDIGEPLGLDPEEAAAGMYRVINANMGHGVREITVERGLDPREFPIVVAGGAGALHACMIARELEVERLLVPATASVLCAAGMLLADLQHDFVRSHVGRLAGVDPAGLLGLVEAMVREGDEQLGREGIPAERRRHEVALDLRYLDQYHEVTVPVGRDLIERGDVASIAAAFHAKHDRLYGYDLAAEGTELELINLRVRSLGRGEVVELPRLPEGGADPGAAAKGRRRAWVPEEGSFLEVPVFDGGLLEHGNVIEGPALVERPDTTIFVSASFTALVDAYGSCALEADTGGRRA